MGIEAVYPHKRTTIPGGPSGISPYRLRGLDINRPKQVIVLISLIFQCNEDLCILFAILDWCSRKILAWELSNTWDAEFFLKCLK